MMQELKKIAEKEHYMDLSEAVRSFLRKKMLESSNKRGFDNGEIKDYLKRILEKKISEENKKLLAEQLRIIEELLEKSNISRK